MRKNERAIPTNYADATRAIRCETPMSFCNLPGHMRLVRVEQNAVALYLYATPIVTFYPDGSILLNTGGYRTSTTKAKMNAALRHSIYRVVQRDHEWFLAGSEDRHEWRPFDSRTLAIAPTHTGWLAAAIA